MAEINKIKVGETTYGINPSWATGDGVNTDIQIGGQNKYLTIGTHGPITMSTAVKIIAPTILSSIDVANKALYIESNTITIGSNVRQDVNIVGNLLINGNPIPDLGTLGTIQKFVEVRDNLLYLGTRANYIQLGTGDDSIRIGSDYAIAIGIGTKAITIGTGGDIRIGSELVVMSQDNTTTLNGVLRVSKIEANPINGGKIYIGEDTGTDEVRIGDNAFVWKDEDDSVYIDGCKFKFDSSTSKFTISYNGKKAEIQLN